MNKSTTKIEGQPVARKTGQVKVEGIGEAVVASTNSLLMTALRAWEAKRRLIELRTAGRAS